MILVDWMQNLFVSTAVGSYQRQEARDREILEERLKAERLSEEDRLAAGC